MTGVCEDANRAGGGKGTLSKSSFRALAFFKSKFFIVSTTLSTVYSAEGRNHNTLEYSGPANFERYRKITPSISALVAERALASS